ncbi:MMPL family transporter [Neisseria sp. S1]|uniref:MMPL family transporter n=1 Tax=Neisseria sp. S1 TaxID=3318354 RepID=UPI003A840CF8
MMKKPSHILYCIAMAAAAVFLTYMLAARSWLQTDLSALLPQEQAQDVLLQAADRVSEAQLNGQVVLLVGSSDADKAFQTASELAQSWRSSGIFEAVDSEITPDLEQVRSDTAKLGLAVLPLHVRRLLFDDPKAYFKERAQDAVNPFAAPSPLPLDEDWLGFGRFTMTQAAPQSRLQWHAASGMLFTEGEDGKTWVWLRGRLPKNNDIVNASADLPKLLKESRALAAKQQAEVLSAGGAVFAATAKKDAERESRLMSTAGLGLTLALLLWVFRSGRVLVLVLPLLAGMLAGLAAVLAVFGQIHILTIVIGTSLIGMLVDFPLHWLTPSVFSAKGRIWQAERAMKHVLPTFAVSLVITVAGYALLWFTPLPILRQTAVFSGFALLGAFGATVCWLPLLFVRYQNKSVPFATLTDKLYPLAGRLKKRLQKRGWVILAGILLAIGLWRSDWHDDIRQWVAVQPEMLAEAQAIGHLSGADFGGQYIVVEAADEDGLLLQSARVEAALQPLIADKKLDGVQSLNQWIQNTADQQTLRTHLKNLALTPRAWASMREIGVPRQTMKSALEQAASAPTVTLSQSLQTPLAEAWQPLYLGEVIPGRWAAVVRLNGVHDVSAVKAVVTGISGIHWADKRAHLNELFHHTRNQAAWLKLASYALALLVLWKIFGIWRGMLVLAVPLASALCTVAVLGWIGLPVSLFAMFGLLLVSAIGVDYAVYAGAVHETAEARLGGMLLAALTTGISFVLLATSSTPAVAAFGISVAVGVVFNLLFASWLLDMENKKF